MDAFAALYAIKKPGVIVDLPYRWRREIYSVDKAALVDQLRERPVTLATLAEAPAKALKATSGKTPVTQVQPAGDAAVTGIAQRAQA